MGMTVIRAPDGKWSAVHNGSVIGGPFETSADAWRWVDRHEGEPISPAEKTTEWIVGKILGGTA